MKTRYKSLSLENPSEEDLFFIGMEYIAIAASVSVNGKSTVDYLDPSIIANTIKKNESLWSKFTALVKAFLAAQKNALKMRAIMKDNPTEEKIVASAIQQIAAWDIDNLLMPIEKVAAIDDVAKVRSDIRSTLLGSIVPEMPEVDPITGDEVDEETLERRRVTSH